MAFMAAKLTYFQSKKISKRQDFDTRKISGGTKNGKATLREELNVLSADATTTASNLMINMGSLFRRGGFDSAFSQPI